MLGELGNVRQRLEFGLQVVCVHALHYALQHGMPASPLNLVGNYAKSLAHRHAICHSTPHRSNAAMQSQDKDQGG